MLTLAKHFIIFTFLILLGLGYYHHCLEIIRKLNVSEYSKLATRKIHWKKTLLNLNQVGIVNMRAAGSLIPVFHPISDIDFNWL